jgi:prepilin-type N-terminal cleavage/methylation domain-containing protein
MYMQTLQRGFTLYELLGALAIATIMMVGVSAMIDSSLEDSKGQQTALYQSQVSSAAAKYISKHYAELTASASAAVPVSINLSALQQDGFLSSNFSTSNAYGQTPCVLILQPTPNKLDALIVTEGGAAIPNKQIGYISANAGQGGGYIASATPLTATGAFNSWTLPAASLANYLTRKCSATAAGANHLATALFYDGPGQLSTDFLYRDAVPGRPELNRMNTPLRMVNATQIAIENQSDTNCSVANPASWGGISANAQGEVLSCQVGIWRRQGTKFWRDPVATFADFSLLPASDNKAGDVRMVTSLKRAFTWDATTSNWVALAVDQNGDMNVPGKTTTNYLQLNQVVTLNTACAPNGLVARDANGLILSCQAGIWSSQTVAELGASETAYSVILTSSKLSYPPGVVYTGSYSYNAPEDTQQTTITRKIVPTKSGMISISLWSIMDRELYNDDSVIGQFYIVASIRDDDTNAIIGSSIAKSPVIYNDTMAISTTLLKVAPKNNNGYTVLIDTFWTTYSGNQNIYHRSNYLNAFNQVVEQTPLQTGWTIDLFY